VTDWGPLVLVPARNVREASGSIRKKAAATCACDHNVVGTLRNLPCPSSRACCAYGEGLARDRVRESVRPCRIHEALEEGCSNLRMRPQCSRDLSASTQDAARTCFSDRESTAPERVHSYTAPCEPGSSRTISGMRTAERFCNWEALDPGNTLWKWSYGRYILA
jgi:hypothetical protein